MSSGLVALTFTSLVYFNMIGMRLWFKKPISRNVFVGGLMGAFGITLLFWKEILGFQAGVGPIFGVIIGIVATLFASTGNMFAYKNHRMKVPVVIFNSYGMLYGALMSFCIGLVRQENFAFPTSLTFILSLIYLAVFGSVIAFWAYQTLVTTIGADRAAYSSIIAPMIAVVVSSLFENVKFTPHILGGIIFCILGNLISIQKDKLVTSKN